MHISIKYIHGDNNNNTLHLFGTGFIAFLAEVHVSDNTIHLGILLFLSDFRFQESNTYVCIYISFVFQFQFQIYDKNINNTNHLSWFNFKVLRFNGNSHRNNFIKLIILSRRAVTITNFIMKIISNLFFNYFSLTTMTAFDRYYRILNTYNLNPLYKAHINTHHTLFICCLQSQLSCMATKKITAF